MIIPPCGEWLPASSSGDGVVNDTTSCDMDQNPVHNTGLISADIDLDLDNDSDESDSEYFEGYIYPHELNKSGDKLPSLEDTSASANLLVVSSS